MTTPLPSYPPFGPRTSGMAVTSVVLGFLGMCVAIVPLLGAIVAFATMTFAFLGLFEINRGEAKGRGVAITGLVLGSLLMALQIAAFTMMAVNSVPTQ